MSCPVTVYGCDPQEADLVREIAPRLGVRPRITAASPCGSNVEFALGSRCISVGHKSRLTNDTLRALSEVGVQYVSTRSIGRNHIDVDHAARVGIAVGNVCYSPDSVADYTLMLILMALRHAKTVLRRTDVHDYRLHETPGRELRDLTVGVVGTGRIGAAVLERLCGFGCRVLAFDTRPATAARYLPLDDLLRRSDVVTLHTPLDVATHHLLDHRRLALLKDGAIVVNTGRGALVETGALLHELESGRLGGAALDVVEGEEGIFYADRSREPAGCDPLRRLQRLPNVLISPHTAYYTDHALRDIVENSLRGCLAFEDRRNHG